jgi:hypothetical protein
VLISSYLPPTQIPGNRNQISSQAVVDSGFEHRFGGHDNHYRISMISLHYTRCITDGNFVTPECAKENSIVAKALRCFG